MKKLKKEDIVMINIYREREREREKERLPYIVYFLNNSISF